MKLQYVAIAVVLIVLAVLPFFLTSYYVGLAILVLIGAIFAMSLDILLGYTGLPPLGHAFGFGVGAYVAGFLAVRASMGFWQAALAGVVGTVIVAGIFGVLQLRARGVYFLMISLALCQVLWGLTYKWTTVTRGEDGLTGIPKPDLGILGLSLTDANSFYYFTLIAFVLSAIVLYTVVHSPFGLVLRGIRDSETRMQAIGYDVWRYQYAAFIISAAFAGIAGILTAYYNGVVVPDFLHILTSAKVALMVIVGGAGTLFGPIIGALIVVLLQNFVSAYTERWVVVLGAIYILVIVFAPQGVYRPIRRRVSGWLSTRARQAPRATQEN